MKLIKLFGIITVNLLFTGCCVFRSSPEKIVLTSFPPSPKFIEYKTDPVIYYDKSNKNYIITQDYMKNSLNAIIYIDEIKKWKTDNGIR
jgi:hypothetical protein